jgi:hypothetical protein
MGQSAPGHILAHVRAVLARVTLAPSLLFRLDHRRLKRRTVDRHMVPVALKTPHAVRLPISPLLGYPALDDFVRGVDIFDRLTAALC